MLLVLFLACVVPDVSAKHSQGPAHREPRLPAASISLDFDGDGGSDIFKIWRVGDRMMASVSFADGRQPQPLYFPIADFDCESGPETQGCVMDGASLEDLPLTRDSFADFQLMFDMVSTDVFAQAGTSHAVSVPVGDTDPFIFFWNIKTQRMDWMRL